MSTEKTEPLEATNKIDEQNKEDESKSENDTFDFSSTYTDNLPKILKKLNISLAVTSYQTARVFFIRTDGDTLETHFKQYPRPMGIYADEHRITLGTFSQVLEFKRSDELLESIKQGSLDNEQKFSKKVLEKDKERLEKLKEERKAALDEIKKADALYLPRASITTGMINIHDIAWGTDGLWVVNSTFSCLSTLSPDYSFVARWKPPFISELVPEDRCHLNGMAMRDGKPRYVTTFNKFDERDSWTKENPHDGTLIDIKTNTTLIEGMVMPHSPRYYNGFVYVCESGEGRVWKINPNTREKTELARLQGFTRGINFYGGLMFVGLSKTRASDVKKPIPLSELYDETFSGIWVLNPENGTEIAHLKFEGDLAQIYDIAVIPNATQAELLSGNNSLIRHIFDYQESIRKTIQ